MSEEQSFILFKRTRDLELKISEFLTNIIHTGFLFSAGLEKYLDKGVTDELLDIRSQISTFESKDDALRRDVEMQLYVQMILPDVRSDIIKLLEGCDKIINKYEDLIILISVEKPKIPRALQEKLIEMVKITLECVNALVVSVRCFFSGIPLDEFSKQVSFFEHQIDKQAMSIKSMIFEDKKLNLARQLQLKEYIQSIEHISDMAEDVADSVTIMSAKHAL